MAGQGSADLEHMGWLVESRSRNQSVSLDLYRLILEKSDIISSEKDYTNVTQGLVAVCFSLWRAVFLSEVKFEMEETLDEAKSFLDNLILHNSVTYMQDYKNREWSFRYYLNNAHYRLEAIEIFSPSVITIKQREWEKMSAKEFWIEAQTLLELAISNFRRLLEDAERKRVKSDQ